MSRFGVQLPLSKDFARITNLGTRHSAALGLAERTDALILIVSEEHGTISVARQGELKVIADPADLQDEIEVFLIRLMPDRAQNPVLRFFTENWREKLIAAAVSVLLWFFFVGIGVGR